MTAAASRPDEDAATACDRCLRRAWLVARLSGHIERAWASRRPLPAVLSLPDGELIAALAGRGRAGVEREYAAFSAHLARDRARRAGVQGVCRCDPAYPDALRDLPDPPAVVHLLGAAGDRLAALCRDAVAIVGARRATPYGLTQARKLAHGLARAGVPVISGMALGIDAAAHAGALDAGGVTVAVLAGGPERPYPASKRHLHQRIAATGAIVGEMPPGTTARRWGFPARNRLIAALARVTVVVEASDRSGSLITASLAADLGREVAAVPGPVTAPLAVGTNALIADGARLVRGPQDVLDLLFGPAAPQIAPEPRPALPADLQQLLERIGNGSDHVGALVGDGMGVDAVLAGLAQLELRGHVRRAAGGRYVVTS